MALTFNLPSQIVVQTAAQWAADATVYTNKRILVTSDEYYGSTDQRKFKIADGVQTWSNLDYMPIEQVTTSTIGSAINGAASAIPNDTDLVMSVESSVAKKNTWTQIKAFLKTYFDTVYQAAGTYLTSANITQVITNGVTDKAPSEDAVYDALALKANSSLYLTNTSSSTTGDTNENILYSSGNLSGQFSINSVIRFLVQFAGTSSANSKTIKLYVGTSSNSLTGATQLATYTFTTNTALQKGLVRNMRILSALNSSEIIATVTSGLDNDETSLSSNANITSIGFDFSGANIYFHITGQNSNSGETITLRHSRAQLIK